MNTWQLTKILDAFFYSFFKNGIVKKIVNRYLPKDKLEINLDLSNKSQKHVLICYVPISGSVLSTFHAAYYQQNQMILYFINRGWCIDLCWCMDIRAFDRFKDRSYDLLIGQGPLYRLLCENLKVKKKILYCTENSVDVVTVKYQERIKYFKERHPNVSIKNAVSRIGFFTHKDFELSDEIIVMSSEFNAMNFEPFFNSIYTLNVNAICNPTYKFNLTEADVKVSRFNFVVFGCFGFIHKGIDILCDAFKLLPDCQLNIYGMEKKEIEIYDKIKPINAHRHGIVNVMSDVYINEIINKNSFVILDSCSEGMASGVATCMMHGLIPIVTKESGFNEASAIVELDDYKVESIVNTVRKLISLSDAEILNLRYRTFEYARNNFSIGEFTRKFSMIMDNIYSD
ncbi:MAG: glycosyltransferase [Bacteroides caccae]|jgi:glycosyltransferase involved in cell wall biosynthesis|uniref:glycosyltransferase n=1 Tax=Bacteroides caccae TaxID=47678 RepID=UPI0035630C1C